MCHQPAPRQTPKRFHFDNVKVKKARTRCGEKLQFPSDHCISSGSQLNRNEKPNQ